MTADCVFACQRVREYADVCLHVLTCTSISACKCSLFASLKTGLLPHTGHCETHYGGKIDAFQGDHPTQRRRYWSGLYGEFLPGVHIEGWCFLAPGDLFVFKGLEVNAKRVGGWNRVLFLLSTFLHPLTQLLWNLSPL